MKEIDFDRNLTFLLTDGGRADFKCAQFVHSLFSIQEKTDVEINHIVMAPYHGHGSADAAKRHREVEKLVHARA